MANESSGNKSSGPSGLKLGLIVAAVILLLSLLFGGGGTRSSRRSSRMPSTFDGAVKEYQKGNTAPLDGFLKWLGEGN